MVNYKISEDAKTDLIRIYPGAVSVTMAKLRLINISTLFLIVLNS